MVNLDYNKKVTELSAAELRDLVVLAIIDGMTEVSRRQATARADQIATQLLKG